MYLEFPREVAYPTPLLEFRHIITHALRAMARRARAKGSMSMARLLCRSGLFYFYSYFKSSLCKGEIGRKKVTVGY